MSPELQHNIGLAQLARKRLEFFGDEPAVKEGPEVITFRQLHDRASALAREIQKHGIQMEEPIGILTSRRMDHIVCQVAVVYTGATCVPLDVDLPDDHITELLRHLNTFLVLTDIHNVQRLPSLCHIPVDCALPKTNSASNGTGHDSANSWMACAHIFHTSGSTGKPKAVRVLAKGLINLVFNEFSPVSRGSRVGQACNIGFDVSLWEVWSALLHGALLVVFSRHETLDAPVFRLKLRAESIDVLWQTTSLLATITHICPDAYSTVDTLLTGGEAINVQTVRTIFANGPPRHLYNVYGPTELSVFAVYHQVSPADIEKGDIPIGKPLSGYKAFVVDDNLQAVSDGEVGELVVGGAGVAAGYFDNPEKTAAVFVSAPHLFVTGASSTGLVYRTGDLVRKDSSGLFEYLGRRDNEVKILGQRVDLQSVERCLLETNLVSSAVALKATEQSAGGSSFLKSIQRAYVQQGLHLMTPRLKLVEAIPLTQSGKVDRKGLVREYEKDLEKGKLTHSRCDTRSESIDDHMRDLWGAILGLPRDGLCEGDDFFALGGTSLHAAHLVSRINQSIGVSLRVAVIFESPTLSGMCEEVRKVRNGVLPEEGATHVPLWIQDMTLGRDVKRPEAHVSDWKAKSEGRVFLTGATGFVGAFMLMELLALPNIKSVACLVRARDESTGLLRIRRALKHFSLFLGLEHEAKIIAIPGDLAYEDLALGKDRYQQLAEWSSVVFHLAAHINFVQPYSSHRAANVLGTLNVIRFSQSVRSKALHYTSSISAYGPTGLVTGARQLSENEPPESHKIALFYDTGYAQSQFAAETIVWNSIYNGLPIAIYRLGSVLGHSETGSLNTDDFLSRLVRTCIQNGAYPSLPGHREDIVPVDFVVSSILHISSSAAKLGRAYNIVHPSQPAPDLHSLFQLINKQSDKHPLRETTYTEWIESISKKPDHPLSSLMPILEELVWDGRSRWQMQQDMPEFSTENLRRALFDKPEMLKCPSPSSLIKIYVPQWTKAADIQL
ncbi:hypothetical protein BDV12DRAFT_211349 [Aspergillus spectabilis]